MNLKFRDTPGMHQGRYENNAFLSETESENRNAKITENAKIDNLNTPGMHYIYS